MKWDKSTKKRIIVVSVTNARNYFPCKNHRLHLVVYVWVIAVVQRHRKSRRGKNDSRSKPNRKRIHNFNLLLLPSLSLLYHAAALIFRFSHLNKTVRCWCCVIVTLFVRLLIDARLHTHSHIVVSRLLSFSYKQIYIFYRETHHIFRVVVTHNNNQTGR